MIPSLRLAALIALMPLAAPSQEVLSAEGMAGVGVQGCETITGVDNAPVLAAAVDWGLGYMAGRRDGGHRPVPGEPLSTTDPADLAVGILRYCRENPYGLVLDALRSYGRRVFAEGPEADPAQQPRLPRVRPPARPADLALDGAKLAFLEVADGLEALAMLDVAKAVRLPTPVMLFSLPPEGAFLPPSEDVEPIRVVVEFPPELSPRPRPRPGQAPAR